MNQKNIMMSDGKNVHLLVTKYGRNRAADMLGLSRTGLHGIIHSDQCRYTYDELARMILADDAGAKPPTNLWIIKVPDEKTEMLGTFLTALNIKYAQFKV